MASMQESCSSSVVLSEAESSSSEEEQAPVVSLLYNSTVEDYVEAAITLQYNNR